MQDEKYPGFDLNPIIPEFPVFEYLNTETALKLFESGFTSLDDLTSAPLDVIRKKANLSDSECNEIESLLVKSSDFYKILKG